MCVKSLLCGPQADLWPFYGFSCKRFSWRHLLFFTGVVASKNYDCIFFSKKVTNNFEYIFLCCVLVISCNRAFHFLVIPQSLYLLLLFFLCQPRCSLHIHITLSHWLYYIPGVVSSDSAVGIIVAQGLTFFTTFLTLNNKSHHKQ